MVGKVLILGIGNLLMQDEGIGVHLVRYLKTHYHFPNGVELLDGGTGGFHLLAVLDEYPLVIILDAIMDGNPPGHLTVLEPEFSTDYPRTLTAHDIGLKDLLDTLSWQEKRTKIMVMAVSIHSLSEVSAELSEKMQEVLPSLANEIYHRIVSLLSKQTG